MAWISLELASAYLKTRLDDVQRARVVMKQARKHGSSGFLSAPWLTQPPLTPHDRYYGFGNTEDNLFFPQIDVNWKTLALSGVKTNVDTSPAPYNGSHRLTTSNDSQHSGTPIHRHNLVVTDKDTPLDSNEDPAYLAVWRYLIGP